MPLGITRRVGQSVIINENTKITLMQNCSGKVRLYITAPDDVLILRDELLKEGDLFYDDELVVAHREKIENKKAYNRIDIK